MRLYVRSGSHKLPLIKAEVEVSNGWGNPRSVELEQDRGWRKRREVGLAIMMISHASALVSFKRSVMHEVSIPPSSHTKLPHTTHRSTIYNLRSTKQMIENLLAMEQRRPPEYIIEVFADPSSVRDVVRGTFYTATQGRVKLMWWDTRDFTHDLLPQVLPLYTAPDERYTGFDTTLC